ncbi:MAG: phosphoglycolate phosphatase [Alphaproteobacteria bacterium]|jgi:phosphoglycolate phosphatase
MKLIVFDVSGTLHDDAPFSPMYDGMKELIVQLHSSGVLVALATNLSRAGINRFISSNGLAEYLAADITLSEAAPKPNPEMLETVILSAGADKENTLMVGDSGGDIYMAKQAKVKSCAVKWQGEWRSSVLMENPEYKVETLDELCHILSQFTGKKITT